MERTTAVQAPDAATGPISPADVPVFTVCVLLFGDFPELAARCLSKLSLLSNGKSIALRIGTNAVSKRTEDVIRELGLDECVVCRSQENIKKYPMMRRLFRSSDSDSDAAFSIATPYVMWFDDDSYVSAEDPHEWLGKVRQRIDSADMVGAIYSTRLCGNQASWVKEQSWYSGLTVPDTHRVFFCVGGWWVICSSVLEKYGWPTAELIHRGGDVMLGELCRQQNLRIAQFREGVAINADAEGRESKSPRRGYDSAPVGFA